MLPDVCPHEKGCDHRHSLATHCNDRVGELEAQVEGLLEKIRSDAELVDELRNRALLWRTSYEELAEKRARDAA